MFLQLSNSLNNSHNYTLALAIQFWEMMQNIQNGYQKQISEIH